MQAGPKISVYWPWLVVISALLAVVPSLPISGGSGQTISCYILSLYGMALYGKSDPFWAVDNRWILLHAAVSVALAVVAAALHRIAVDHKQDSKTFSMRRLMLTITAIACVFSLLASIGAMPVLYAVALIVIVGWAATLLLAAVGL